MNGRHKYVLWVLHILCDQQLEIFPGCQFCRFALAVEEYCFRDNAVSTSHIKYLNIARSAVPLSILNAPDGSRRWFSANFQNFQIFGLTCEIFKEFILSSKLLWGPLDATTVSVITWNNFGLIHGVFCWLNLVYEQKTSPTSPKSSRPSILQIWPGRSVVLL